MSSSLTSELSWQLEQSEASWAAAGDDWNDESAPPYLDMVNSSAGQQLMMATVLDAFPAAPSTESAPPLAECAGAAFAAWAASGAFAADSAATGAPSPQQLLETLDAFLQPPDSVPEPIIAATTPSAAAVRAPPGPPLTDSAPEQIAATRNNDLGTPSVAALGALPTDPVTYYSSDRRVLPEQIAASVNDEPSGAPSDAAADAPSYSALELAIQKRLREVKEPHITWHIVLNNHASKRPKKYGGPLCASVTACKAFTRVGEAHSCRIVLPNSYAPDDGKVVDVEATAPDKATAEADAGCAAFARLCADKDGLPNVIFRPKHWNVSIDTLINDIGNMVDASVTFQPLAVHQRRTAASGAMVEGTLENVPEADKQRAEELVRLCLRSHDGSFAPNKIDHKKFAQVAGRQEERAYAQLASLLPIGSLRQFIEQHPEFDIDETQAPWRIKWSTCGAPAAAP